MDADQIEALLRDPDTPDSRLELLLGHSVKSDRMVAVHPRASDAILSRLAQSADRQTRRGVATNPQTPKEILLKLAPTFAGEFFLNPVFDLLLLEDPYLLDALPITVIKNILRRDDCPASLLRWAAAHGGRSHHLALVARSTISRGMLEQIAAGPHGPAAETAANRLMRGEWCEAAA
jgi:hypothetical protein